MRFASLGSGSQGNATLVAADDTLLMVDCGFAPKEAEARLQRVGVTPASLDAILVTHEHGDHCAGVASLSKRHGIPVYLTHGTAATNRLSGCHQQVLVNAGARFSIGSITCSAVPVPHDAREPVQFRFDAGGWSLGILTDLGSITPHLVASFSGCDGLLLEFNHELDLLMQGPYPGTLKRRVAGDFGHLNNAQAGHLLSQLDNRRLRILVAGHLSQQNNSPEHALAALAGVAAHHGARIQVASQDSGFDWLSLLEEAEPSLSAVVGT